MTVRPRLLPHLGRRVTTALTVAVAFATTAVIAAPSSSAAPKPKPSTGPQVSGDVHHDVSPPLSSIPPAQNPPDNNGKEHDHAWRHVPNHGASASSGTPTGTTAAAAPATLTSFAGVGNGFSGPQGAFSVQSAPPDTVGDVGPNHYVQMVNSDFAVFNKSGTVLYGPVPTNTLWSGFGGGCQTNNDGDGIVRYDPIADRWTLSQFSVSTTPYLECVAVSRTSDPTGAYNRYSFSYGTTDFPDYPKLSVWPDAYYVTYNIFANGSSFSGAKVCALDRAKMLTGAAATQQCFNTSNAYGGILAADLDGSRLPPAGEPESVLGLGASSTTLAYWKFHADFATPTSATFTGPTALTVPSYLEACSGGTCIPQSGTTQQLDSLADRLMDRLAYRNFGDHESLVVTHSITSGSSSGLRWYELRLPSGTPSIYQSGTYAPDGNYRWMGSIAMDQAGDMGLGFSLSSSSLHPEIHYTGRLAADPVGTMSQGEGTIINGAGSQTGSSLSRWGDYSSMTVDPSDDCTFWYTNEYIPANGAFNWSTRIGSFKFPGCGGTVTNDFSVSASPSTVSVVQGGSGTSTISTAVTSGSAQTVNLSVSGLPAGASASFSPTSVTSGGSSTLTLSSGTAAPGTYPLTVTGTGSSATHTTSVSFTVTAPVTNDFSISASPSTVSVVQGGSGTSTISTAVTTGSAQTVNLSVSGVPTGATASFSPTSVTAGGASTLTIATGTAAAGTYSLTVTGSGASATHSTSISLTITAVSSSGIVNGGFEAGSLSGWTVSGASTSVVNSGAHSGTYAARLGSTSPTNGDSSVAQTFVAPTGTTGLSLWSKMTCPDTITYDWSLATLTDNTAGTTATVMAKQCVTNSAYVNKTATVVAGHSYTLTLTSHDDNYATDASYTLFDDVVLTSSAPPPPTAITNGGFETGTLSGWTATANTAVVSGGHSGTYAARVGSTAAFNGDSSISQTFTVPSGGSRLSLWSKVVCTDTVTYDWMTVTLKNNTTGVTTTLVGKTCTNTGAWVNTTAAVSAGASYTLTLLDHDDGYATDPTYTLFDDVATS